MGHYDRVKNGTEYQVGVHGVDVYAEPRDLVDSQIVFFILVEDHFKRRFLLIASEM